MGIGRGTGALVAGVAAALLAPALATAGVPLTDGGCSVQATGSGDSCEFVVGSATLGYTGMTDTGWSVTHVESSSGREPPWSTTPGAPAASRGPVASCERESPTPSGWRAAGAVLRASIRTPGQARRTRDDGRASSATTPARRPRGRPARSTSAGVSSSITTTSTTTTARPTAARRRRAGVRWERSAIPRETRPPRTSRVSTSGCRRTGSTSASGCRPSTGRTRRSVRWRSTPTTTLPPAAGHGGTSASRARAGTGSPPSTRATWRRRRSRAASRCLRAAAGGYRPRPRARTGR